MGNENAMRGNRLRATSCEYKKKTRVVKNKQTNMPKTRVRRTRRRRRQRGGLFPLAALIPALIAGGKAVALGAAGGAASYGAKKGLEAAFRKRRR